MDNDISTLLDAVDEDVYALKEKASDARSELEVVRKSSEEREKTLDQVTSDWGKAVNENKMLKTQLKEANEELRQSANTIADLENQLKEFPIIQAKLMEAETYIARVKDDLRRANLYGLPKVKTPK